LCLPVLVLGRHSPSGLPGAVIPLLLRVVQINLILANFNLLPIPPLDGSWILGYFLRGEARRWYASLQARGFQAFLVFMIAAWLIPGLMNLAFFPFRAGYGALIRILLLVAG
ncbi:MAG TPA: site-2 protease family protein, partial [bacterium]|nr:site-2 protease family protein [bacterium]